MELINDIRTSKDFQGYSFSNHKKSEVRKQLLQNILNSKIEESCYWSAELICAGHFVELWDIIIIVVCRHIHLANPKLILYIENRYEHFKKVINCGEFLNELDIRNDHNIRTIFCEIICILCFSNKKPAFELLKIQKKDEFDLIKFGEKLKANNNIYASTIFLKEDPNELYIPINEFMFHLSDQSKNMLNACFWIEWIIDFNLSCKKKKNKCTIQSRQYINVENKYLNEPIWLIWDALLHYGEKDSYIDKLIKSLLNIFCIKFSDGSSRKRRYLIYFGVSLIIENIDRNISIIQDKNKIKPILENIEKIYKQIKKKEQSPNTEYMFHNVQKEHAIKKSIAQINLVNSIQIKK